MDKNKDGFIIHITVLIILFVSSLIMSLGILTTVNRNKIKDNFIKVNVQRLCIEDVYIKYINNEINEEDIEVCDDVVYVNHNSQIFKFYILNDCLMIEEGKFYD